MSVPAVTEIDPGRHWEVESRSFAPGATWAVTYRMEAYAVDATGDRLRWEMRCPCPHGARQLPLPLYERRPCAHMRAVVAFQEAKHRRPAARINAGLFCD